MSDITIDRSTKYNNHPYLKKWDLYRVSPVQKSDIASVRGIYQHLGVAIVSGIYAYESTAAYTDRLHTPYSDSAKTSQDIYMNKIAKSFRIQCDSILAFIASNLGLANLLLEIYEHIRKRFPNESLDLFFDEDMPNVPKIAICASADNDETFLKFNEFNENWWFPKLDNEDSAI
ncbi:MAG: hypothetical protein ACK573_15580, partial [Pseudanabaena sp.]